MDKTKTWTQGGVTVTATIAPDGNHTMTITGTMPCPMYWPGDAYEAATGDEMQLPKHGEFTAETMLRTAYAWIARNAPYKTRMPRQ
jgi:hypothetical protein